MSIYTLVNPKDARKRRDRVIDVARAGDFGTFHERVARAAWTIAILEEEDPGADPYEVVLPLSPSCSTTPTGSRRTGRRRTPTWTRERGGHPVRRGAHRGTRGPRPGDHHRPGGLGATHGPPVHHVAATGGPPGAVHNATDRFRLVYLQGRRYEVQYRYETWVQYTSRRPAGRIDLDDLASQASALETSSAPWLFTGVSAIFPTRDTRRRGEQHPAGALPRAGHERAGPARRAGTPTADERRYSVEIDCRTSSLAARRAGQVAASHPNSAARITMNNSWAGAIENLSMPSSASA